MPHLWWDTELFEIEDLLLLERFQIGYLPGYVPERELAVVLHAYPSIKNLLIKKHPPILSFVERITSRHDPVRNDDEVESCCQAVTSGIPDLIGYNRFPEMYDAADFHGWDFVEVTGVTSLAGKVVVDGGAGTGRVAFAAAATAKWVFAVEPVARLRQFIKERARADNVRNLFVVDGFLHSVPLPNDFVDVLITSHALGWNLAEELAEFERVVSEAGFIIHCPGRSYGRREEQTHSVLIAPPWHYAWDKYEQADGMKRKYWKQLT